MIIGLNFNQKGKRNQLSVFIFHYPINYTVSAIDILSLLLLLPLRMFVSSLISPRYTFAFNLLMPISNSSSLIWSLLSLANFLKISSIF